MIPHPRSFTKPVLLLAASGLALGLAGCKVDNRPLLARNDAPDAYSALPQPGPAYDPAAYGAPNYGAQPYPASYLPPERAYPYAERAYGYDAPPAYGFAYGDEQPWVWETADDGYMFAEPYGDDYRFYYYEPGADYPYFVRDANYGYAYGGNGALIALFDAAGALLSANDYGRYAPGARQYWSRGYDLYSTYNRAPRYAVDQNVWRQRAPNIARADQRRINAAQQQPAWRQWRANAAPSVVQRFESVRPGRFSPGLNPGINRGEGRADNGRHEGWARNGAPPPFAAARPPVIGRQDRGRGFGRQEVPRPDLQRPDLQRPGLQRQDLEHQDRGGRFAERGQPAFAPSVQTHGRDANWRGQQARMAEAGQPPA
ncbi:hypothetical protein, partial [Phenylobacterium sp.]|uniref:hypothetical protein n=1 Tax=Phenylobacterium sp. TaxID=1871053 RepID=UPI002DE860B0|nr:hypothetical protein [Phenylobacterium sp.]